MEPEAETVIIGAGAVGLSCATALAAGGREVLVVEQNPGIGEETSSRNSEVIHAGIYYSPGSAKARLCVAGKTRLYDYCRAMGVPTRTLGKLIVATRDGDMPRLGDLLERAQVNGVNDLKLLNRKDARSIESALHCHAAIWSPSTGIVDSHQLLLSLQGELESMGGFISLRSRVVSLKASRSPRAVHQLKVETPQGRFAVHSREVVNCAGLSAVPLAWNLAGSGHHELPEPQYSRGNYFRVTGRVPFSHLVYPVPEPGGLGIHLTLDMTGAARFGPDVEPVPGPDNGYVVDPGRAVHFYPSIRQYWPDLPDGALTADYSGIRPKIHRKGQTDMDFEILGPGHHEIPGLVHCLGIESPGLTSCLAIADEVVRMLDHYR